MPLPTISPSQSASQHFLKLNFYSGTSLVVQWIGIRLPMQGTRDQSLIWEDPTGRGLLNSVCPELLSLRAATTEARGPRACAPDKRSCHNEKPERTVESSLRSLQLEKAFA